MRTSIDLDDQLIKQAMDLSQIRTKKEVIHLALKELVNKLKRLQMLQLRGKIQWVGKLDEMREI
jgi:Arc/MetJ family transcription regulator